jgi:hypothetical protein
MISKRNSHRSRGRPLAVLLTLTLLAACAGKQEAAAPAETAPAPEAATESGLVLDKEQIEKLGIATQPVRSAHFMAETSGYGQVLGHESIALMTAEIATAEAAARQSRAALARVTQLAGTPGAFPAENVEAAEHLAAADAAALNLAQQKLTASLGQHGPWTGASGSTVLRALATGQTKLVRATFPSGSLGAGVPQRLRVARFGGVGKARDWSSSSIWEAPADANVPGRSLFALISGSDVSEGERLQVWAASGDTAQNGVVIPAAAVLLSNDAWWCFVEKPAGHFTRTAIDTSRPLEDGYFVIDGVAVGDAVVTMAAGMLLARELNPSTEAE